MTLKEKIEKVNELISSIRNDVPYIDIVVDQGYKSTDLLLGSIGYDEEENVVKAYAFEPMPFK